MIATRPEIAEETMREGADLGIEHVWMHRDPGAGSVSKPAADYGRRRGISVIDSGCPCMFDATADFGHRVVRQGFEPFVTALSAEQRAEVLGGAAALAAPVFDATQLAADAIADTLATLHGLKPSRPCGTAPSEAGAD